MKPISDRAKELFVSSSRAPDALEAIRSLSKALDEYQCSVEERLASIGLGFVSGRAGESVLASGRAEANTVSLTAVMKRHVPAAESESVLTPRVSGYESDPVESEE